MGIPIGHGTRSLSAFGVFIEQKLSQRGLKLTEFAEEHLKTSAPNMSRYLRGRRPPERIVTEIVTKLGLTKDEENEMQAALDGRSSFSALRGADSNIRLRLRHTHRRSMRTYGESTLRALIELVQGLDWGVELCEVDDDFAYDLKVFSTSDAGHYVLVNFIHQQHRDDSRVLLRATLAQVAIDPDARQVVFFEAIASNFKLTDLAQGELVEGGGSTASSVGDWLQRETKGLGSIAHGGNLIRIISQFVKPTEAVHAYLRQL